MPSWVYIIGLFLVLGIANHIDDVEREHREAIEDLESRLEDKENEEDDRFVIEHDPYGVL